jgi:hypothetical protein
LPAIAPLGAQEWITLGEERGGEGHLIQCVKALAFDQQPADTRMDGQRGNPAAEWGHTRSIRRIEPFEKSPRSLDGTSGR